MANERAHHERAAQDGNADGQFEEGLNTEIDEHDRPVGCRDETTTLERCAERQRAHRRPATWADAAQYSSRLFAILGDTPRSASPVSPRDVALARIPIVALPARLVAAAFGLAALLAAGGAIWELLAFGPTTHATAARVEREVRATVAERASEVESLARRVAQEGRLIADASASRDNLPALFDRLIAISEPVDQHDAAVTIYEPDGPPGSFRVLAWSDGPGERNLASARLAGPATLFIAPGHAGMRLVFVEPVEFEGRRVAVAVAETVLATTSSSPTPERHLPTSFGPVSVIEQYASTRDEVSSPNSFVIASATGAPLLEVHVNEAALVQQRTTFRKRNAAIAMLPLVALLGLTAFPLVERRRRARRRIERLGWTALTGGVVAATAAGFLIAASVGNRPSPSRASSSPDSRGRWLPWARDRGGGDEPADASRRQLPCVSPSNS